MEQYKVVMYICTNVACDGCHKVYNVVQIMWSLKHRLVEHQHALWNGYVPASALAEHALSTGHLVDLSKSDVIECHLYVTTYCP